MKVVELSTQLAESVHALQCGCGPRLHAASGSCGKVTPETDSHIDGHRKRNIRTERKRERDRDKQTDGMNIYRDRR